MTSKTPEDTRLTTALMALSHHVLHLFAEVGRTHRLSQQQVEMICAVIARDRVRMADLGRLLYLEKSNLSNLVDRAEQRGLVVRTRDPHDRRATWVELTSEGTSLAIQTHTEVTTRLHRLINHLPPEDQKHLTAVIEHLLAKEAQ